MPCFAEGVSERDCAPAEHGNVHSGPCTAMEFPFPEHVGRASQPRWSCMLKKAPLHERSMCRPSWKAFSSVGEAVRCLGWAQGCCRTSVRTCCRPCSQGSAHCLSTCLSMQARWLRAWEQPLSQRLSLRRITTSTGLSTMSMDQVSFTGNAFLEMFACMWHVIWQ